MQIKKNYAKLNLTYLCKQRSITVYELQKILNVRLSIISVVALVKICNYFAIDMDTFVGSDLQKMNEEI